MSNQESTISRQAPPTILFDDSVDVSADPASRTGFWSSRSPLFFGQQQTAFWRDALLRRVLALADLAALLCGGVLFELLNRTAAADMFLLLLLLPICMILAKVHNLYSQDQDRLRHLTVDELPRLLAWASAVAASTLLLSMATGSTPRAWVVLVLWAALSGTVWLFRGAARWLWRRHVPADRTLIIGDDRLAARVRRKVELFPDIHVDVVGVRSAYEIDISRDAADVWLRHVERLIIGADELEAEVVAGLADLCRETETKLTVVLAEGRAVAEVEKIGDLAVLEYSTAGISRSTVVLKRVMDVSVAAPALLLLAPIMLVISLAIVLDSRGSPIFAHERAGKDGRAFWMYKFRSMVADAEDRLGELVSFDELAEPVFKFRTDHRVTRVGRLLRRTSLDELPQLINVLRGDMSLVGPRPEQVELVARYLPEHRLRLAVKPGVTGPMQVGGRGTLTFQERLALEREYIETISVRRDLRILALSIAPIVTGRGAF
jgi:exopolysaccharide biosynthesis polyprenyl glycosylphosphotransferase